MQQVTERILRFNTNRLTDKLIIKYQALADDPFRFFRGTCHLFYEDLSKAVIPHSPLVWMCGDLHFENFGSYKGDNRQVYFDLNDFDEGILGPAAWELVRMVTSLYVGGRVLRINDGQQEALCRLFLQRYATVLSRGKARYIETATAKGVVRSFLRKVEERTQKELLGSRTEKGKKHRVISTDEEKYFSLTKELRKALINHVQEWEASGSGKKGAWKILDACFRVAGTGSVGLKRYALLMQHAEHQKLYRLLDMKEVPPSSLSPYLTIEQPSWKTEGERSTAIKFRMQNASPSLMSTTVFDGTSFRLQELQPSEDRIDFASIKERKEDLEDLVRDMALLTASAQLRSSGRQGSANTDDLIRFGESTHWQEDLLEYAFNYSRQVINDWKEYKVDFEKGFESLTPGKKFENLVM